MKRCPECGGKRFYADAHVTETWIVGEHGDFICVKESCVDVAHEPSDIDIWECAECGYTADGYMFNVD